MKSIAKISVEGVNLDNLIKKISLKTTLFNVKKKDKKLKFSVDYVDVAKIQSYLENYKYSIKFYGLKNLKNVLKRNLGIICAMPFIFGMFLIYPKFIWDIKVYGVDENLKQTIEQVLKDNGIKRFSLKSKDKSQIESLILNNVKEISSVSSIFNGTSLIINVSEKLVKDETEFQPIIATYSGIIKAYKLISGTMNVKVGDFVFKGDVLVKPYVLDIDGKQVQTKPIAEIQAECYVVGQSCMSIEEIEFVRTGRVCISYDILLGNKKLFTKSSNRPFNVFECEQKVELVSSILPIYKRYFYFYELKSEIKHNNLDNEKESVILKSEENAYKNFCGGKILDVKKETSLIQGTLYATTTLIVEIIIS